MSKNGNSSDAIMITGRQHAKLVLITATVVEKVLELAAPGMDPIRATIPDTEDNVIRTKVRSCNHKGFNDCLRFLIATVLALTWDQKLAVGSGDSLTSPTWTSGCFAIRTASNQAGIARTLGTG